MKLRMRTKFLLSMLLISAGLTCTSLLLVRRSVQTQVKKEIFADLHNSVSTFQNFQRERDLTLSRLAELLADLPTLRALMTTQDEATIQDASADLWRHGGSDLFVLADRTGKVVALHTSTPGFTKEMAQRFKLGVQKGVIVTDVADNSLAAQQGIEREDVITEVDNKPITDVKSFRDALNKSDPKRGVLFYLDRKGAKTFAVLKADGNEAPSDE